MFTPVYNPAPRKIPAPQLTGLLLLFIVSVLTSDALTHFHPTRPLGLALFATLPLAGMAYYLFQQYKTNTYPPAMPVTPNGVINAIVVGFGVGSIVATARSIPALVVSIAIVLILVFITAVVVERVPHPMDKGGDRFQGTWVRNTTSALALIGIILSLIPVWWLQPLSCVLLFPLILYSAWLGFGFHHSPYRCVRGVLCSAPGFFTTVFLWVIEFGLIVAMCNSFLG